MVPYWFCDFHGVLLNGLWTIFILLIKRQRTPGMPKMMWKEWLVKLKKRQSWRFFVSYLDLKCVTINKTTGDLNVLSHGEELNPRCFSPKDFRHDSELLKPTAGKLSTLFESRVNASLLRLHLRRAFLDCSECFIKRTVMRQTHV